MTSPNAIAGLILAGGASRRMGGGDKALALLAGRPMLAHVVDRFAPEVAPLAINANGDGTRFAAFAYPVISDRHQGLLGPLAGVHTGLVWAKSQGGGITYLATVPADAPFVPRDLVGRLRAALEASGTPIAIATSATGRHPVAALWSLDLEAKLHDALARGIRKVGQFVDEVGAVEVAFAPITWGGRTIDPFMNINTPEDLTAAERFMQTQSEPTP